MNYRDLIEATTIMRHCTVVEKTGQCISFELFDEKSNEFLLACAMETTTHGTLVFSTLRDCHLRSFRDIQSIMNKHHPDFVAKMTRDWLSGLTFDLVDVRQEPVCQIKFLSSVFERLPISFKMKIFRPCSNDIEPSCHLTRSHSKRNGIIPNMFDLNGANSSGNLGLFDFSCLPSGGCLEDTDEAYPHYPKATTRKVKSTQRDSYGKLSTSHNVYNLVGSSGNPNDFGAGRDIIHLETRKPQWNREIRHWVHNFSGRVRIPSNRNFLVTVSSYEFMELGPEVEEEENRGNASDQFSARSSDSSKYAGLGSLQGTSSERSSGHSNISAGINSIINSSNSNSSSSSSGGGFARNSRPAGLSATALNSDVVCIRHGKSTSHTYVLDFRAPVSPLVAFAAMCATQAAKPLVSA